jgi:hypothetical protein
LPPLQVDLITMTGNVAQVFLTDEAWDQTLRAAYAALKPDGRLVFETRVPGRREWREWPPGRRHLDIAGVGVVETWGVITEDAEPFLSFRGCYRFASDDAVLVSDSTLRFRSRAEVARSLDEAHFVVDDVRDAPDRPGREMVFLGRRPALRPSGRGGTPVRLD